MSNPVFLVWQEVQRLQKEADEANKHSSMLERDNRRFEVQLGDMAHQVRLLGEKAIRSDHCVSAQTSQ